MKFLVYDVERYSTWFYQTRMQVSFVSVKKYFVSQEFLFCVLVIFGSVISIGNLIQLKKYVFSILELNAAYIPWIWK